MANEIKAKQDTSLALFGDDVSKGFENMTQDDMALPFVRILGQLSPQVTDGDAKYIEGAKPGMIYNTVVSKNQDFKHHQRIWSSNDQLIGDDIHQNQTNYPAQGPTIVSPCYLLPFQKLQRYCF